MIVYEGYSGIYNEDYYGYGFKIGKFIKRALPKPIKRIKPAKFIKRATGSKKMAEALLKTAVVGGAAAGGAYLLSNPALLAKVGTVGTSLVKGGMSFVKPIASQVLPQVIAGTVGGNVVQPIPQQQISPSNVPVNIPVPYPTGKQAESYWIQQPAVRKKSQLVEYLPLIAIGGGILLLALLLRR